MEIYTDGCCKGNPGQGGWGVYCEYNKNIYEYFGSENMTTNNRMELTAVIRAIENLYNNQDINIYTDSTYVYNGITKWIHNWKKNNWKNANNQFVKNQDLWIKLDELIKPNIHFFWVKGHNNNFGNEKADFLANKSLKK
jgi:ribonuclease HI